MNPSSLSKHLSSREFKTLARIGNIYLPGSDSLPSFLNAGVSKNTDRLLDFMPRSDLKDLKLLLFLLSFLPHGLLRLFIWSLEKAMFLPEKMGATLRLIRFGLRGLAFSLYYGDESIHQKIEYSVRVYTDDL